MARSLYRGAFFAACFALAGSLPATAQVPPHAPGTICFTPSFWCWATPPGPPGATCFCPSQRGPVQGVFG